jgi:hypothetical protein
MNTNASKTLSSNVMKPPFGHQDAHHSSCAARSAVTPNRPAAITLATAAVPAASALATTGEIATNIVVELPSPPSMRNTAVACAVPTRCGCVVRLSDQPEAGCDEAFSGGGFGT